MSEYTPSPSASIGYMQPGYILPNGLTVGGPEDLFDPGVSAIDASIEDVLRTQSLLPTPADDADLAIFESAMLADPLPIFTDPCDEIAARCEARADAAVVAIDAVLEKKAQRDFLRRWWVEDVKKASEPVLMFWLSDADKLQAIDLEAIIIAELTRRSGGACRLAA
jgi:hypothetical protein